MAAIEIPPIGSKAYTNPDLDETAVQIKASQAIVRGVNVYNNDTDGAIYVHFYNALAANVSVGTTVPDATIGVPASGNVQFYPNWLFDTAFTVAATTSAAGTGNPGSNDVVFAVAYS